MIYTYSHFDHSSPSSVNIPKIKNIDVKHQSRNNIKLNKNFANKMNNVRPSRLSELTPIILYMDLTHLASDISN